MLTSASIKLFLLAGTKAHAEINTQNRLSDGLSLCHEFKDLQAVDIARDINCAKP
jgi:hypothetical protein